ncbi:hypothetical protein ANN_20573 [Periplaneta americana]|uniref:Uncharacterized protein n=1 Tax=Periplaneta americana TaxID=6978 RepID=A0ABQ8SD13_PERAM|nr:hypothetical protein ANN_20573 [Periplaneta americana]
MEDADRRFGYLHNRRQLGHLVRAAKSDDSGSCYTPNRTSVQLPETTPGTLSQAGSGDGCVSDMRILAF